MSEHQRNEKTFAQDALGFLFCGLGAFFAVSIVLFLNGQEPKAGVIEVLTSPVVELVALLGAAAALLFSFGLAALGTLLFLRTSAYAALRPFLALAAGALGLALVLGAFGRGGELGGWLPGLVQGFAGRTLTVVLGLALGWFGWTLVPAQRAPAGNASEALQRMGLGVRHDAAGVSPAEAALLGHEPRAQAARPAPRRAEPAPVRDETIRPFTPAVTAKAAPAEKPREARVQAPPVRNEPAKASAIPLAPPAPRAAPAIVPPPPVPSWEAAEEALAAEEAEEVFEPQAFAAPAAVAPLQMPVQDEEEPALASGEDSEGDEDEFAALASDELDEDDTAAFDEDELEEDELDEELEAELAEPEEEPEETLALSASEPAGPRASWEQVGLFDEDSEEEPEEEPIEELQPVKAAKVETPTFDFDSLEPRKPAHEPEPEGEDPFAGSPPAALAKSAPVAVAVAVPAPAPIADFLLQPAPAPRAEPVVATDDEGARWSQLVFEAGCAILEQKRVAVSMLERRFGIDFDQACRVLDELQQAGLIGPYMGGRTRDILLTREEWLSHAPHAS